MRLPRTRFGRIAKRTGLVLCVVIVVVAAWTSIWFACWPSGPGPGGPYFVALGRGFAMLGKEIAPDCACAPLIDLSIYRLHQGISNMRWIRKSTDGQFAWVTVPLWMPLLVVGIPTAFLFWRDRRYPPGHCQRCGYDLTGNLSGVCPECGTDVREHGANS